MAQTISGELAFNPEFQHFNIIKDEEIIGKIQFGDEFEVEQDGEWKKTRIEIGSNDDGELVFKLKDTPFCGDIEGLNVRIEI